MAGQVFAIAAAISLAFSAVSVRQAMKKHPSSYGAIYWSFAGAIFMWAIALVMGDFPNTESLPFFFARGLFEPGIAALLLFGAMYRLGVSVTIPIIAANPVVSTTLAVIWLGEQLSVATVGGTVLIIAGIWILTGHQPKGLITKNLLLRAVAGAVVIGIAAPITKMGLTTSPTPIGGLAFALTTAFFFQLLVVAFRNTWSALPDKKDEILSFMFAGILSSIGFLFIFLALSRGPVSVIMPLIATQPLFALLVAKFAFKGDEIINRFVIIGTITIVLGGIILAVL